MRTQHPSAASYTSLSGIEPATWEYALEWESNQQPSGVQDDIQPTEPHWPGIKYEILYPVRIYQYVLPTKH